MFLLSVVVSFICVPVIFVLGVVVLVVVAFPKVLVLVAGVVSVSRLHVAVSGGFSVPGPLELFHVDAVLSLSPFFSVSHLFASNLIILLLFRCRACSLFCLPVLSLCLLSLFHDFFGLHMIIIGFVVVVKC